MDAAGRPPDRGDDMGIVSDAESHRFAERPEGAAPHPGERDDNEQPPAPHPMQFQQQDDNSNDQENYQQGVDNIAFHHNNNYPPPPYFHPSSFAAGLLPPPHPMPQPPPASHQALAMAHYYEARMRDHAAAYASAAAGAAWAAAQIAAAAAEFAASAGAQVPPPIPPDMPPLPTGMPTMPPLPAGFYPADGPPPNNADANYYYPPPAAMYPPVPPPHHPSQQQQMYHPPPFYAQEDDIGGYARSTRRKRSQRRPPGAIGFSPADESQPQQQNSRVRRRLRDFGGDSGSNSSCCSGSLGTSVASHPDHNNNNPNNNSNYAARGTHYHRYKKKQRQPRDDTRDLLGKNAVSALYEFCNKRKLVHPTFVTTQQPSSSTNNSNSNAAKNAAQLPVAAGDAHLTEGDDFALAVYLGDVEWGRGRGRTKQDAKQDAARRAMQTLLPGVVIDAASNILVELPPTSHYNHPALAAAYRQETTATTLEDLAPNLAKRLAIGRDEDDDGDDENDLEDTKPPAVAAAHHPAPPVRGDSSKKLKRIWNVYPGTTTSTSEEEDDNAYYASRGASFCSVLLHTMVQIDDRIPEGPKYAITEVPADRNAQLKRKGPASCSGGNAAVVIHRGSFTCTATLMLLKKSTCSSPSPAKGDADGTPIKDGSGNGNDPTENSGDEQTISETSSADAAVKPLVESAESSIAETSEVELLEAAGQGSSKREAKHKASAQLLALLFPECKSMVEVKAAAEAVREKYAASKARKQQQFNRAKGFTDTRRRSRRDDANNNRAAISLQTFGVAAPSDPPLPEHLRQELRGILGKRNRALSVGSVASMLEKAGLSKDSDSPRYSPSTSGKEQDQFSASEDIQESLGRQLSRQKQLEERVDAALQALNEHDDEGRSLPEELTVDDVGRTVLRRAEPDDLDKIRKLFSASCEKFTELSDGPLSILGASAVDSVDVGSIEEKAKEGYSAGAQRLWSSSTCVLLLCRAIAPFEDPPLGCAVLTLGFSMERGPLIRVAQLASEPHLPRERFLECLEAFARCVNCHLETTLDATHFSKRKIRLTREDLQRVLFSHLSFGTAAATGNFSQGGMESPVAVPVRRSNMSCLQSVQEESEGGYDTDKSVEVTRKSKAQDKPSKRSRVE